MPDGAVYRAISGLPQNMISRGCRRFFHEVIGTPRRAEQLIPVNLLDDPIPTLSPLSVNSTLYDRWLTLASCYPYFDHGDILMLVTNLFVKRAHGEDLEPVATFDFNENGIVNGVPCSPLRQVLITSRPVTIEFGLNPGDLRENIVVDADELYELPSGTVVAIGSARIRLTFHCEPCKALHKVIEPGRIVHKRGVLGCFLNSGTVSIGDSFSVTEQKCEAIPYKATDRIRWLLGNGDVSLASADLVHALGLPSSYARAMPHILQKLSRAATAKRMVSRF